MSDENVIKLHPMDSEALNAAIEQPGPINVELRDLLNNGTPLPIPINLPDGLTGQIEFGAKPLGFDDLGAALNMRDWLERACEAKGAKKVGGGFGFGVADLDIELEGHRYNVTIKPL